MIEESEPFKVWHSLPAETALERLGGSLNGLDDSEALSRLLRHGRNRLPKESKRTPFQRLIAQFNNLLILVLIGAAGLAGLLQHFTDAAVILTVALVNAAIGFIQEGKAERALEAVGRMLSSDALVLRAGQRKSIPAEELVPGDIVVVEAGDLIPADLRLLRCKNLQIEEASLTGESVPVEKAAAPVAEDALLGDRRSMAFSSTLVTSGQATGIVVATGPATEIGRIGTLLAGVKVLTTPLLRQMDQFARRLTFTILGVAALIFVFGNLVRNIAAGDMFMVVVGLAVAAIPEGLPTILTIALAIGVQRMASRRAIIRRLPAVETLGAVSVICSDKTGTLTRNEMTVQSVTTADCTISVTGLGYEPAGAFLVDGQDLEPGCKALLQEMARGAILCSNASLRQDGTGNWAVDGDPMEGALISMAGKAGIAADDARRAFPRLDEVPFDAQHRFMATLHHESDAGTLIYIKGAPERILNLCHGECVSQSTRELQANFWNNAVKQTAAKGMRVLAIARKTAPSGKNALSLRDCENGFVLLGLFGFIDPPRAEATDAVAECRSAGIQVKMITGDHAGTAGAIAAELGLENPGTVMTGADLEEVSEAELRQVAAQVNVFARTSPEHKLRLVQALQATGQVVAMTGDGVNDAPALKRADIGIAMGGRGTEAARQASNMVLTNDNFASIVAAVREGRTVYDNLKKAILFLLPINGGEAMTIIAAILLGYDLPITPLQILWVNMVSSVTLALALAFEPAEPGIMRRPPRPAREPLLTGFLVWRVMFVSLLFLAATAGAFFGTLSFGLPAETARTMAVNTLVATEVFYLFNVRYLARPSLTFVGILGTRAVFVAVGAVFALQLAFTYLPFMNVVFGTTPLTIIQGAVAVIIAITVFAILEVEKALRPHPAPHRATGG